jgi:hypothetical protein
MLRIHFLQHWFSLADLAYEEALYDSVGLRRFAGIDLGCEAVPDATTMLKFRRLLEQHQLAERLFSQALVGLHQSTLPGLGQERGPRVHGAGAGQPLPGSPSLDGAVTPVMRESRLKCLLKRPKGHATTSRRPSILDPGH